MDQKLKNPLKNSGNHNTSLTNLQAPMLEKSNKSSITDARKVKKEVRPLSSSNVSKPQ